MSPTDIYVTIARLTQISEFYYRDPRDSLFSAIPSNPSQDIVYELYTGTIRIRPTGRWEVFLDLPRPSCTDLNTPPETPATEVRCTCGANVRKALPGYNKNEANGCELTQGETEHCEKAKQWPSKFDTTNCSGKIVTSVVNTIRKRQRMYQPWWSQNQKRVLHDADLKRIVFGELQSGDDKKDTAWNKFVHQHIRQKAESCQDIGTTLEQTHEMRAYLTRGRAGRGRQVSWPENDVESVFSETEEMRSAFNEDGASQWQGATCTKFSSME